MKIGKPRGKAVAGLTAVIVTAGVVTASLATAGGGGQPDGSVGSPTPTPNAPTTTSCGMHSESVTKTEGVASSMSSTAFTTLPGASTTVVISGGTACIKVLFTSESSCSSSNPTNLCYVRAMDNAAMMLPDGGGLQAMDSNNPTSQSRAYEWVRRVGTGTHVISIQRRVGTAGTVFTNDDWTFDVDLFG